MTKAHKLSPEGYSRDYGDGPIGRYYRDFSIENPALFSAFSRVSYFRQSKDEKPDSLRSLIAGKLDPAPDYQAASPELRPRTDFILPRAASGVIGSVSELIACFDTTPPLAKDVMLELKFTLTAGPPAHRAFESVRAFALHYLADERGLASILVLHLPSRAGSANPRHVHLFGPARQLAADGFGHHAGNLLNDAGAAEVWARWCAHMEAFSYA